MSGAGKKLTAYRSWWPLAAIAALAILLALSRCDSAETWQPSTTTASASVSSAPRATGAAPNDSGTPAPKATTRGPAGEPVRPSGRSLAVCDVDRLPEQARRTIELVKRGGPFPHPRNDGVTFRNDEGLLPARARGYYREYTVPDPAASDRGARRILTGGDPATAPPEWYYTGDHYDSFCRVTGL